MKFPHFKKHPNWNENNLFNGFDILLYILDSPVTFTDKIQPACLPFNKSSISYPSINSTALIAGWGKTNGFNQNSLAIELKNALVQIYDCKKVNESISDTISCSCNNFVIFLMVLLTF